MFFFRSRFFFFFWNDSKITRLRFGLNIFNQRIIIRLAAYHSSWRIAPSTMSFCQASDRAWWVIIDDQPRQRVVQAIADTLSSLPVNREDTFPGSIDFLCISINLLDVISRAFTSEIPRRREMEKNEKEFLRRLNDESVTFKGNRLSNRINSNASFFFFFFLLPRIFFLQEEMFLPRGLWLGVPDEMTPQMDSTLAVVSSRRATRRLIKEKREGKKKIITPFANPFRWKLFAVRLSRGFCATRSRSKFILSTVLVIIVCRARLGWNLASCN